MTPHGLCDDCKAGRTDEYLLAARLEGRCCWKGAIGHRDKDCLAALGLAPKPGRLTRDEYYLEMLSLVAGRSTCPRRAVGAVIVDKAGHVLSTGYNGVPSGVPHCVDVPCPGASDPKGDTRRCLAIHAEQNALLQCSRLDLAHTLYVSVICCFTCAKLVCNTPIKRIVAAEDYVETQGKDLLTLTGREVVVVTWNARPHAYKWVGHRLPEIEG